MDKRGDDHDAEDKGTDENIEEQKTRLVLTGRWANQGGEADPSQKTTNAADCSADEDDQQKESNPGVPGHLFPFRP